MSLWLQSSLSFGQAKQYVAEQANKQGPTEMLDRAGRSIQAAVQHWNSLDNWRWLQAEYSGWTLSSGTSGYSLPFDFKDAYLVTLTSSASPASANVVEQKDRRNWYQNADSVLTTATSGFVYDLFSQGSLGLIGVHPTPGTSAGTLGLHYYRNMTVPCKTAVTATTINGSDNVVVNSIVGLEVGNRLRPGTGFALTSGVFPIIQTIVDDVTVIVDMAATATVANTASTAGADTDRLDIPSKYQWNILAWAVHHFMVGVGAPIERMNYWQAYAARGEQDAKAENNALPEDMEICIGPDPRTRVYSRNSYRW